MNKFKKSIFFKILLVMAIAFILIVYSTRFAFKNSQNQTHVNKMRENSVNFARLIVENIGSPPDFEKAIYLAKRLNVGILIDNSGKKWSHPLDMKTFDVKKLKVLFDGETRTGNIDGELKVFIHKNDVKYYLNLEPNMGKYLTIYNSFTTINLFFSALSLLFIYIVLRWILNPVKTLHRAIKLVSSGNLKFLLKSKRKDELGDLINSFEHMKNRIDYMVKAREQLLLDVSHELRSPVTRIKLSLEMIEDNEEKQNMFSDVNEIETMINVLLDSGYLNRGKAALDLKKTDVVGLFREVCAKFRNEKIQFNLENETEKIFLKIEPKWIKILFRNLVSNAVKYSDKGKKCVNFEILESSESVIIAIHNFGVGIPKSDVKKVFEPFYRVDKSRSKETEGYGLGLSICKKIMDAHEGEIKIISNLDDKITTVSLRFEK